MLQQTYPSCPVRDRDGVSDVQRIADCGPAPDSSFKRKQHRWARRVLNLSLSGLELCPPEERSDQFERLVGRQFRVLSLPLHPDKHFPNDEQERVLKKALYERVNQARDIVKKHHVKPQEEEVSGGGIGDGGSARIMPEMDWHS